MHVNLYQPCVRGYALLMTMIFISVALLLLVSVMNWTNSSARQTERNNLFGLGTGAAEAATERVIAQMTFDFFNQNFPSGANYYTTNSVNLLPITTSLAGSIHLQQSFEQQPGLCERKSR